MCVEQTSTSDPTSMWIVHFRRTTCFVRENSASSGRKMCCLAVLSPVAKAVARCVCQEPIDPARFSGRSAPQLLAWHSDLRIGSGNDAHFPQLQEQKWLQFCGCLAAWTSQAILLYVALLCVSSKTVATNRKPCGHVMQLAKGTYISRHHRKHEVYCSGPLAASFPTKQLECVSTGVSVAKLPVV